ncbi:MAG: adenosine deaminase [Clostridiales bacterium]|nr:adenosine deaminase [Clostridiales bacterium]
MVFFQRFYLDREKDMAIDLSMEGERLFYVIRTPNHHTGNLIRNFGRLCGLAAEEDESGLMVIRGEVPLFIDGDNRRMYILRLGGTKVANIFPDGTVERKASVPAISKTLMSQTKNYRLGIEKTIVKTYIPGECKFKSDLHTHMNGNLPPDVLIALGIVHQIRYPYYYIKKLELSITEEQRSKMEARRLVAAEMFSDSPLTGRYRERRIDDFTFINFADLLLGNPTDAATNIEKIRNSLTVPKDGQAVFANLEKVYLYRYIFTKATPAEDPLGGLAIDLIPDPEVRACAERILRDRADDRYARNTLFQDLLLWICREYRRYGVEYAEISDTALLHPLEVPARLREIHEILPAAERETGVLLRFLAGIRRIPLTIVKDHVTPDDYLRENLRCLRAVAGDPYVAGCDILGEEISDIRELRGVIRELVSIAEANPGFVIRIHAGENDSLRDNVANSIRCVAEALRPEQKMPPLRLGHGLYTCDLRSPTGKALLSDMCKYGVILEFQLTSNVRLNNLGSLKQHPLRNYLAAGVRCVQGTDGGALYGTNSIDEELSLEKLLGLSREELLAMRRAEAEVLAESRRVFVEKKTAFRESFPAGDIELHYSELLGKETPSPERGLWHARGGLSAEEALKERLAPLPERCFPVIAAGGSFNREGRRTPVREDQRRFLNELVEAADPSKTVFVVGHTLSGQEGLLVNLAAGRFPVYAIVPNRITPREQARLLASGVRVLVSIEDSGMGLYKSFAYEIFKNIPSALLAFDGNSACLNLIQEAKNAKHKCRIYLDPKSRALATKGALLQGYVRPMTDAVAIVRELGIDREER